jgi:methionine aminopeptidase type I
LYHGGYHADLNETYYIGDRAKADPDSVRVVEAARESLDEAIKAVKPGVLIREFGNIIEKVAKQKDCSVIRTYCGHGVGKLFHCPPNVPHYAKNKAVGECKVGMTFTIEPMIALGKYRDITWPDNWTSTTIDGKKTAQFGTFTIHIVLESPLFVGQVANTFRRAHTSCYGRRLRDSYGTDGRLAWGADSYAGEGGQRRVIDAMYEQCKALTK